MTKREWSAMANEAASTVLFQNILFKFDNGETREVDGLAAAVLMRASPVFCKMLTHDMREKVCREIELPGKEATELEVLMKFLMPESARQQKLSDATVGFLWKWSEEYMIDCLKDECVQFVRTAKASKNILIAAQEMNLETRAAECVDTLLAFGVRDWKDCYGNHAVMQTLVECAMKKLR
ncbi:1a [Symbiodinium sp. KB8]|nr:1a [Symbiodinium sp. KB8]